MPVMIRTMLASDLEAANAILNAAFQRAESWLTELRLFLQLQPDGVFLASKDGFPAGMVATMLYSHYAYVGLMGVHQDFQRQGLGQALMEHVLVWTRERNVPLVKLDASPAGQPLYEKLGFVSLDEVYVCQRQIGSLVGPLPAGVQLLTPQQLERIADSDAQAFGADRGRLLRALLEIYPGRAFLSRDEQGRVNGHLFAQAKRIGPWIVNEGGDAETLLLAALALPFRGTVSVVTPAENADAVSLLTQHGFQINRVNRHMAYGANGSTGQRARVYGQTSLSLG